MGAGATGQWRRFLRNFAETHGVNPDAPEKQLIKMRQKILKKHVPPEQDILDALKQTKEFEL